MATVEPVVLIVDDEPQIRRFVRTSLGPQGYRVVEAADGAAALREIAQARPDVVVLDLGLPDGDGTALIGEIRRRSLLPIVVLSSRHDVEGKVRALDLGADDYVTKPFEMAELVARLRAALRHGLQQQGVPRLFRSGRLTVDLVRRRVEVEGREVHLSPKEYELLAFLVAHAGRVITHQHLLREIWGVANVDDIQYLRGYVRQLRRKIEARPEAPSLILTEPGVGYRMAEPEPGLPPDGASSTEPLSAG